MRRFRLIEKSRRPSRGNESYLTESEKLFLNESDSEDRGVKEFEIKGNTLIKYNGEGGNITIPDGVGQIGSDAFENAKLTKVTIPDDVYAIGFYAFSDQKSLQEVIIKGNGLHFIGNHAFDGCSSLKKITIPSSVTKIGDNAFDGCKSLKDVYYDGSWKEFEKITKFTGRGYLMNAKLHDNTTNESYRRTEKLYLNENNDNVRRWRDAFKRGGMIPATAESMVYEVEEADDHAEEVFDDLRKNAKDTIVRDPDTGKKIKRKPYTESRLNRKRSRIDETIRTINGKIVVGPYDDEDEDDDTYTLFDLLDDRLFGYGPFWFKTNFRSKWKFADIPVNLIPDGTDDRKRVTYFYPTTHGENIIYPDPSDRRYFAPDGIGVLLKDKSEFNLGQKCAEELNLKYYIKNNPDKRSDYPYIGVIKVPEDKSEMAVEKYIASIGKSMSDFLR